MRRFNGYKHIMLFFTVYSLVFIIPGMIVRIYHVGPMRRQRAKKGRIVGLCGCYKMAEQQRFSIP